MSRRIKLIVSFFLTVVSLAAVAATAPKEQRIEESP